MPDYEIIEWNEDNFDISAYVYCLKAYNEKKWAFVSDFVRLWVLYTHGGIYMDTDVKVFKSFDCFLDNRAFTGFENVGYPVTAVMGAEIGNSVIGKLLEYYYDKEFEYIEWPNTVTNTMIMSDILGNIGVDRYKNTYQDIGGITVYPQDTFCFNFREKEITDDVYAIHLMKRFMGRLKWQN